MKLLLEKSDLKELEHVFAKIPRTLINKYFSAIVGFYFTSNFLFCSSVPFCLQFLSRCIVGATLQEGEEEEDTASVHSAATQKEGSYRIVGTLKDPATKPPDFIAEIVSVSNPYYRSVVGSQPFSDHVPLQHFDRWTCARKISCNKMAEWNNKNPLNF